MTTATARSRVTRWPALRVYEHHLLVYRRTYRGSLFISFLSPVLFLFAMGLGLGTLVDANNPQGVQGISYLVFLAPGLLAATAMQTAAFESTYPIMAGMVWMKTFDAMVTTPIEPRSVVFGQLAWATTRLTLVCSVFLLVIFLFGAATFPSALLALPFAVLTGLAFAAPIQAFAATQKNDTVFNAIFRFGITPLFIFSGTFFPIEQLPVFLQPIAWVTPLFHGVALTRGAALGTLEVTGTLIHLGVLLAFVVAGVIASFVTFRRRLVR
ncbi:ABC transporter permease [soil metagenome]|jgi:lipooligosaccharide transport system permease protein